MNISLDGMSGMPAPTCSSCGAQFGGRDAVEVLRSDSGARVYRHKGGCPGPMPTSTLSTQVRGSQRKVDAAPNDRRTQRQRPSPSTVESQAEILAIWQETVGRKLTPSELLKMFDTPELMSLLGVRTSTAREAADRAYRLDKQLTFASWRKEVAAIDRTVEAARNASTSHVLTGRGIKSEGRRRGPKSTGLGPTQNYSDDT